MLCQLCNKTEFNVIYNTDHPIEKQPVIICYECANKYFNEEGFEWWVNNKFNEEIKGKRCG